MIAPGTDLYACAQIVERGDPERFHTVMTAPPAARVVLFPLYAFNVEVSRAPWVTKEPMIAEMRLQWWRDALAEIAEGGLVRRHEVVTPLALAIDKDSARALDDLVAARRSDIETAPFAESAALKSYLRATGGGLMHAAARGLAGAHWDAEQAAAATALGTAAGLVSYLRAIPALEAAGKRPLADGRPEAIRALANWGLEVLETAPIRLLPRQVRPALIPAAGTRLMLRRVAQQPARVAAGAISPSEARLRWARLWSASTGRF